MQRTPAEQVSFVLAANFCSVSSARADSHTPQALLTIRHKHFTGLPFSDKIKEMAPFCQAADFTGRSR